MKPIHIEFSEVINASPEKAYAVLSDYQKGHPAILPKPYFTDLKVEQGGQGAGTVLRVWMEAFGRKFVYHMMVTEPEPGRILMEKDIDSGVVTTFLVDPLNGGQQSRVTIMTDFKASPGFTGFMERLMNPPITRHIYKQELKNLADYVVAQNGAGLSLG